MKTKRISWIAIALMMVTICAAGEGITTSQTLSVDTELIENEVQNNSALMGYYPQMIKVNGYSWGMQLAVGYRDDGIVAEDRQREVAEDLFMIAWDAIRAQPGLKMQIWVGVTCIDNPNYINDPCPIAIITGNENGPHVPF